MDVTLLFRACVKTVRTTNKSMGIKDKSQDILRTTQRDANLSKAREIVKEISALHQSFLENKFAYLNVVNYLSTNKTMTEGDREQLDSRAQQTISKCSASLAEYRKSVQRGVKSRQLEEHYRNVLDSIENYLKRVSKTYAGAKAVRVKKVFETHRLSKLESVPREKPKAGDDRQPPRQRENGRAVIPRAAAAETVQEELSAEELQMFESENEQLYNELNSLSDEVNRMEGKMVRIAELQELFTEKVLEQEKDIERIATTVTGSTEDMKVANDQIRQAIRRNAGLRVWVLFFLLVMSFSLLFLDWYND